MYIFEKENEPELRRVKGKVKMRLAGRDGWLPSDLEEADENDD